MDAFQREDGRADRSLKAASQGITLTRASNVAFLELDWTPARHDQAEDRLHRIGQENAVTAWYLLAPDTIDEMMAEVLARKRSLINAITDGQVRRGARGRHGGARAARPALPAPARRRLRCRRPRPLVVDVSFEERYWYPDEGGAVWLPGTTRSTPPTGATSPATTRAGRTGLRVAAVAGAARFHPEALASEEAAPAGRSSCGATRTTRTTRTRWRCTVAGGGERLGFVPRELAAELAPELDQGTAWSALCLREQRRSPREPRTGLTMLLGRAEAIELREVSRGRPR